MSGFLGTGSWRVFLVVVVKWAELLLGVELHSQPDAVAHKAAGVLDWSPPLYQGVTEASIQMQSLLW